MTEKDNNELNLYTSNISYNISVCESAIKLLEEMRINKIGVTGPLSAKDKIQQILTDYSVLKLHCLFDKTKGVVSFERLPFDFCKTISKKTLNDFNKKYSEIKLKYADVIKRVENVRHKIIAHQSGKNELGWDEKSLIEIEKIWGKKCGSPVSDAFIFLIPSNFPYKEAKEMLKDLQRLIFYTLWFPVIK